MSRSEGEGIRKGTVITKIRRMPAQGKVLVKKGDLVEPETVLAKGTVINPEVSGVNIFDQLGIESDQVNKYLLKKEGDEVKKDEVIAIRRFFFGRSTKICRSPIDGTIESLSTVSGRALIRGRPIPVEVKAYIPGRVVEIIPHEGAVIESKASLIQGAFGIGGETRGELAVAVDAPDEPLTPEDVVEGFKEKILVGGSLVTLGALHKAATVGVKGIISGSIDQKDLTDFIGHEIGMGMTGREDAGLTLILTEGFGIQPMKESIYKFLNSFEGKQASMDGSTQIRSRMLRPEIIISQ
jgi:hypothetical protein